MSVLVAQAEACDAREASCRCRKVAEHEGPHECPCGGSWEWIDGEFHVTSYPDYDAGPRPGLGYDEEW